MPSLTAWDLRDSSYAQVLRVEGDDVVELSLPFPVTVQPSALLR